MKIAAQPLGLFACCLLLAACGSAPVKHADCNGQDTLCSAAILPLPLQGCSASNYMLSLVVGGSQSYALAIDTGSSTLGIASSQCSTCGVTPSYTPGSSAKDTHTVGQSIYADGSGWQGEIYEDVIETEQALGATQMKLVAIQDSNSFFRSTQCPGASHPTLMQGIMGLGGTQGAAKGTDAYVDALQGKGLDGSFTIQLSSNGGEIWFGGYDPTPMASLPVFTPMSTHPGTLGALYSVQVNDMQLDHASLGIAAAQFGDAIVDTGTNALVLPATVFQALVAKLEGNQAFINNFGPGFFENGLCTAPANGLSPTDLDAALPKFTFTMPDDAAGVMSVDLTASNSYLRPEVANDGQTSIYCPAVLNDGASSVTILGNTLMRAHVLVFDRENKRVGFAPQSQPK